VCPRLMVNVIGSGKTSFQSSGNEMPKPLILISFNSCLMSAPDGTPILMVSLEIAMLQPTVSICVPLGSPKQETGTCGGSGDMSSFLQELKRQNSIMIQVRLANGWVKRFDFIALIIRIKLVLFFWAKKKAGNRVVLVNKCVVSGDKCVYSCIKCNEI